MPFSYEDEAAVLEAWDGVSKKDATNNWVALVLEGETGKLLGTGNGGLAELEAAVSDASQIYFGVFKVLGIDDRQNTKSIRDKYISFVLVGENVKALTRAKTSGMKDDMISIFNGASATIQGSSAEELFARGELVKTLLKSGAAHKPTSYHFGGDEEEYHLD